MNSDVFRIAWACFLGGFIGALVALQFKPNLMWVGVVVGGLVGYVSYSYRQIINAAKIVWNRMPERRDLHDMWLWVKIGLMICLPNVILCGIAIVALIAFCGVVTFDVPFAMGEIKSDGILMSARLQYSHPYWYYLGGTLLVYAMLGVLNMIVSLRMFRQGFNREEMEMIRFAQKICLGATPGFLAVCIPVVVFLLGMGLLTFAWIGVLWVIQWLGGLLGKLVGGTFILIHSDARLICGTDAALGAFIGFSLNNALVGGITGALIGVLHYKFASMYFNKLVPKTA